MKKNLLLGMLILHVSLVSCSKDDNTNSTSSKSEMRVTFKGKSYTITNDDYPRLIAQTISVPIPDGAGGTQTLSKVAFYGENKQIAVGLAAFKKGSPIGSYPFEFLPIGGNGNFLLGSFYHRNEDIPRFSQRSDIPGPGEIVAIALLDQSAGGVSYMPVPKSCIVEVIKSDEKQVSGTFNLQVTSGITNETVVGSFNYYK